MTHFGSRECIAATTAHAEFFAEYSGEVLVSKICGPRTPRRKNFFDGRTDTSLHPQLSTRMHGHLCGAKNEAAIVRCSSGVRCAIVAVSFADNQ
jgi:hypothetical protein